MSVISFNSCDLLRLVEDLQSASNFRPTIEDLFNPELYPDGRLLDAKGLTEAEVKSAGGVFWPDADLIDPARVKPALIMVGDSGLYLMTNAKLDRSAKDRKALAYAIGCNPHIDKDFRENTCRFFGGDDGTVALPLQWATWVLDNKKMHLNIELSDDLVKLVQ
jgi:hypothetical protein